MFTAPIFVTQTSRTNLHRSSICLAQKSEKGSNLCVSKIGYIFIYVYRTNICHANKQNKLASFLDLSRSEKREGKLLVRFENWLYLIPQSAHIKNCSEKSETGVMLP